MCPEFVKELSCALQGFKLANTRPFYEKMIVDFIAHLGNDARVWRCVIGRHCDVEVLIIEETCWKCVVTKHGDADVTNHYASRILSTNKKCAEAGLCRNSLDESSRIDFCMVSAFSAFSAHVPSLLDVLLPKWPLVFRRLSLPHAFFNRSTSKTSHVMAPSLRVAFTSPHLYICVSFKVIVSAIEGMFFYCGRISIFVIFHVFLYSLLLPCTLVRCVWAFKPDNIQF